MDVVDVGQLPCVSTFRDVTEDGVAVAREEDVVLMWSFVQGTTVCVHAIKMQ